MATPTGIWENYLGKEDSEGAEVMKFKKGEGEMLTVIHTHVLSISSIFFCWEVRFGYVVVLSGI